MWETTDLLERVSELRSRSAEIAVRMRRDADQFAEIHHDLADAVVSENCVDDGLS